MARNQLIERILAQIGAKQNNIERELKRSIGRKTLSLRDLFDSELGILLIIDQPSLELNDIIDTYTEWSNMVEIFVLEEYHSNDSKILSLTPDFVTCTGEIDENESSEDEDDGTEIEDKAEPVPNAELLPKEGRCPICGSPMDVFSRAPFITACSNEKCSNSKPPFE